MFLCKAVLAALATALIASLVAAETSDIAPCLQPPPVRPSCPEIIMVWHYDGESKECRRADACVTWPAGGLASEHECGQHCTKYADCAAPFDRGDLARNVTDTDDWYFNTTTGRCERIGRTGAGAHGMHYHSERTCGRQCGQLPPRTPPPSTTETPPTTPPPDTVSTSQETTSTSGWGTSDSTPPPTGSTESTSPPTAGTESTSGPTTSESTGGTGDWGTGTGTSTSSPPPTSGWTPPPPAPRCVHFSVTRGSGEHTHFGASVACAREHAGGRLASIESWAEFERVRRMAVLDGRPEYWMSGEFVCPDCRYEWLDCTTRNGRVVDSWEIEHIAQTGGPVDVCLVFVADKGKVAKSDCERPHRPALCQRPCATSTSGTSSSTSTTATSTDTTTNESETTSESSTSDYSTTTTSGSGPPMGECGCRVTDRYGQQVELRVRLDQSPTGGTCDVVRTFPPPPPGPVGSYY